MVVVLVKNWFFGSVQFWVGFGRFRESFGVGSWLARWSVVVVLVALVLALVLTWAE